MPHIRQPALLFLYPQQCLKFVRHRGALCQKRSYISRDDNVRESRPDPLSALASIRDQHSKSKQQSAGTKRHRSIDQSDGTMTPREKELFSKIFESILVKEQTSMQEDVSRNAISFERSKTTGQASQESRNAERPQATLARDYIGQYSSSLQGNILQAAAVVRNKTARMENNRARTAANYLAAKEELYGLRELDQVYHFLQETLFGPFRSGEVELKNPTPQLLEFCRAYPLLMADVLCILRLSFKDYSACVSVFMQMKELGIESRAIGGSPEVYNEMLLAAFEGWHDLGMVEQLLIEMKQDAIPFDLQTTVILKHIRTTIVSEREGGLAGLAFWSRVRPRTFELLNKNIHEVGEITNAQTTV